MPRICSKHQHYDPNCEICQSDIEFPEPSQDDLQKEYLEWYDAEMKLMRDEPCSKPFAYKAWCAARVFEPSQDDKQTVPDLTQELLYQAATVMVAKREKLIVEAIDQYYGHHDWTERQVAEIAGISIQPDGVEVLSLNSQPVLSFFPIQTETIINNQSVQCRYAQAYKWLL